MAFDDVSYVKEFPHVFNLNDAEKVELDAIGIRNLDIYDSVLIAYTRNSDGFWAFFSLPNHEKMGKYLLKGNGPSEFIQDPGASSVTFYEDNGKRFAGILDFQKGRVFEMNLTETIRNGELDMTMLTDEIPRHPFDFVLLDSAFYFCREINKGQTRQNRFLLKDGKRIVPETFKKLNRAQVTPEGDFNILSTLIKCNPERTLLVEMPIGLNQINIYSVDGSFGKTICVGKKLDNIDDIENTPKEDRMYYTYSDVRVFDDFFGAVSINETNKSYRENRKKHPEIQLFRLDGEPIALLKFDTFFNAFDIDLINGYLYTFDPNSEEMNRYDIKHILKAI